MHPGEAGRASAAVALGRADSRRGAGEIVATAFTHAFVGAALALAAPAGVSRRRLAIAAATVAAAPDLDVVGMHLGIPYAHPLGHRGFTHSLVFAALTGVLGAALLFRRAAPGARLGCALVLALATASHGFLDAFTDGGHGVGFLLPFSRQRFFFPFRPLATSPLEVSAFFAGRAPAILANEFLWVWIPVGTVALMARRGGGRGGPPSAAGPHP